MFNEKTLNCTTTIKKCMQKIELYDTCTYIHSINVANIAFNMGKELNFKTTELQTLYTAAILHDIGKIFISKDILNKPGKLTNLEFSKIKVHSLLGYKFLKNNYCFSEEILESILQHHEKLDGSGYPYGLKSINKYAQIITVADIYDALISKRCYKIQKSKLESIQILVNEVNKGKINKFAVTTLNNILIEEGEKANLITYTSA